MATFHGSGALGMMGVDDVPRGTVEELRAVGLDPAQVGSCAPRGAGGVRGCRMEQECIFAQARYGGFKGKGPKNVGYYKREIDGPQKQDWMPCHSFVQSLARRMRAGDAAREQGQPHEQIRII